MTDLVVLVADSQMESTIEALLTERIPALGIREVTFKILRHPQKDPGVYKQAPDFLRVFLRTHHKALVLLDVEFPGSPGSRDTIETQMQTRLDQTGWQDRATTIAVDPELEEWVWCAPHHTLKELGARIAEVRKVAEDEGWWDVPADKPARPKETLEKVARTKHARVSGRFFRKLAQRTTLERCKDEAFTKLRDTLRAWFGVQAES